MAAATATETTTQSQARVAGQQERAQQSPKAESRRVKVKTTERDAQGRVISRGEADVSEETVAKINRDAELVLNAIRQTNTQEIVARLQFWKNRQNRTTAIGAAWAAVKDLSDAGKRIFGRMGKSFSGSERQRIQDEIILLHVRAEQEAKKGEQTSQEATTDRVTNVASVAADILGGKFDRFTVADARARIAVVAATEYTGQAQAEQSVRDAMSNRMDSAVRAMLLPDTDPQRLQIPGDIADDNEAARVWLAEHVFRGMPQQVIDSLNPGEVIKVLTAEALRLRDDATAQVSASEEHHAALNAQIDQLINMARATGLLSKDTEKILSEMSLRKKADWLILNGGRAVLTVGLLGVGVGLTVTGLAPAALAAIGAAKAVILVGGTVLYLGRKGVDIVYQKRRAGREATRLMMQGRKVEAHKRGIAGILGTSNYEEQSRTFVAKRTERNMYVKADTLVNGGEVKVGETQLQLQSLEDIAANLEAAIATGDKTKIQTALAAAADREATLESLYSSGRIQLTGSFQGMDFGGAKGAENFGLLLRQFHARVAQRLNEFGGIEAVREYNKAVREQSFDRQTLILSAQNQEAQDTTNAIVGGMVQTGMVTVAAPFVGGFVMGEVGQLVHHVGQAVADLQQGNLGELAQQVNVVQDTQASILNATQSFDSGAIGKIISGTTGHHVAAEALANAGLTQQSLQAEMFQQQLQQTAEITGCFVAGTKILMADGIQKPIEQITIGELIFSYDEETQKIVVKEVLEVISPVREHMATVVLANGHSITNTTDHPFFIGNGWASLDPEKTKELYGMEVTKLDKNTTVYAYADNKINPVKIVSIETITKTTQTYNLSKIADTHTFFANGILVHNKGMSAEILTATGGQELIIHGTTFEVPQGISVQEISGTHHDIVSYIFTDTATGAKLTVNPNNISFSSNEMHLLINGQDYGIPLEANPANTSIHVGDYFHSQEGQLQYEGDHNGSWQTLHDVVVHDGNKTGLQIGLTNVDQTTMLHNGYIGLVDPNDPNKILYVQSGDTYFVGDTTTMHHIYTLDANGHMVDTGQEISSESYLKLAVLNPSEVNAPNADALLTAKIDHLEQLNDLVKQYDAAHGLHSTVNASDWWEQLKEPRYSGVGTNNYADPNFFNGRLIGVQNYDGVNHVIASNGFGGDHLATTVGVTKPPVANLGTFKDVINEQGTNATTTSTPGTVLTPPPSATPGTSTAGGTSGLTPPTYDSPRLEIVRGIRNVAHNHLAQLGLAYIGYKAFTETGRRISARPTSNTNASPANPRMAAGFRIARDVTELGFAREWLGNRISPNVRNRALRAVLPDQVQRVARGLAGPRTVRSLFFARGGLPGGIGPDAIGGAMGITVPADAAGRIALARRLLEETPPNARWRVVQLANNLHRSRSLTADTAAEAMEAIVTPNMASVAQKPVVENAVDTARRPYVGGVANWMSIPPLNTPVGRAVRNQQQQVAAFANIVPPPTRTQLTQIAHALRGMHVGATDQQVADAIDAILLPAGDIAVALKGIADTDVYDPSNPTAGIAAGIGSSAKTIADLEAELSALGLGDPQILVLARGLRRVQMEDRMSTPRPSVPLNERRAEVLLNIIIPDIETAINRLPHPDDIAAAFMGAGNDVHAMALKLEAEMTAQLGKYPNPLAQRKAVARAVADMLAHRPANAEAYAIVFEKLLTANETEAFRTIINDADLIAAVDGMKRPVPADRAAAIGAIKAYGEKVLGRPMTTDDYAKIAMALRITPPSNATELQNLVERQLIQDISAPLRLVDDANIEAVATQLGLTVPAGSTADAVRLQIAGMFTGGSQQQAIELARLYNDHVRGGNTVDGPFGSAKIVEVYLDTMAHVVDHLATPPHGTADEVAVALGATDAANLATRLDAELQEKGIAAADQRRLQVFKAIVAMKTAAPSNRDQVALTFQHELTPALQDVLQCFTEAELSAMVTQMGLTSVAGKNALASLVISELGKYRITDAYAAGLMVVIRPGADGAAKADLLDGKIFVDLESVLHAIPDAQRQAVAKGFGVDEGTNADEAALHIKTEIEASRAADTLPPLTPAEYIALARELRQKTNQADLITLLNAKYPPSNPSVLLNRAEIRVGSAEQQDLLDRLKVLGMGTLIPDRSRLEAQIAAFATTSADRGALYTLLVGKTPAERALIFEEKLLPIQHQLRVDLQAANGSGGIDGADVIASLNTDFGIDVAARIANPAITDPVAQLYAYVQGIHGAAMPASANITSKATAKEIAELFENLSPFGNLAEAMRRGKVADKVASNDLAGLVTVLRKIQADIAQPDRQRADVLREFLAVAPTATPEQRALVAVFVSEGTNNQERSEHGFTAAAPSNALESLAAVDGIQRALAEKGLAPANGAEIQAAFSAAVSGATIDQKAAVAAKVAASNPVAAAVAFAAPSNVDEAREVVRGAMLAGVTLPNILAELSALGLSPRQKGAMYLEAKGGALGGDIGLEIAGGFTRIGITPASSLADVIEAFEGMREVNHRVVDSAAALAAAHSASFGAEMTAGFVAKVASDSGKNNTDSAQETFEKIAPLRSANDAVSATDGIIAGLSASPAEVLTGFEATSPTSNDITAVVYGKLIEPTSYTPATPNPEFNRTHAIHEQDYVRAYAGLEHSGLNQGDDPTAIIDTLQHVLGIDRAAVEQAAYDFGFIAPVPGPSHIPSP